MTYRNVFILIPNPRWGHSWDEPLQYTGEIYDNLGFDLNRDQAKIKEFLQSKGYDSSLDLAVTCNCTIGKFSGTLRLVYPKYDYK